jgi:nicotinic acid mononucleotide adenylyltransferase
MGSAAQVLDSNADSGIGRGNTPDRQDSFDQRGGEVSPSLESSPFIKIKLPLPKSKIPHQEVSSLPELGYANFHLANFPFITPQKSEQGFIHYEGSFDPLGPHHMEILESAFSFLGFKRAVLGICHQNPDKAQSTEFDIRVDIARAWIKQAGIPIAEKLGEPGIYVERDADKFQLLKITNFYNPDAYQLMGADNFEVYYRENRVWTHIPQIRSNAKAHDAFGFRSMYQRIENFPGRILVYPLLHSIHSTEIRREVASESNGELESKIFMPDEVRQIIASQQLYSGAGPKVSQKLKSTSSSLGHEKVGAQTAMLRLACQEKLRALMRSAFMPAIFNEVDEAVRKAISLMDRSQLASLKGVTAYREGDVNGFPQGATKHSSINGGAKLVVGEVLGRLTRNHLEVSGEEGLLDLMASGKPIVLVSSFRGAWDLALSTAALDANGLSEISEGIRYVVRATPSQSVFESAIVENSVRLISILGDDGEIKESQTNQLLGEEVLGAVNRGCIPFVYVDAHSESNQRNCADPRGYGLAVAIQKLLVKGEDAYVVPVATTGGLEAFTSPVEKSVWATEETPYVVRFGPPIAIGDLTSYCQAFDGSLAEALTTRVAEIQREDSARQ